jgi:DNA-binding CsgD family transcriptional regulator
MASRGKEERAALVLLMLRHNYPDDAIADLLRITRSTVATIRRRAVLHAAMQRRRAEGCTTAQIAQEFGVSVSMVQRGTGN